MGYKKEDLIKYLRDLNINPKGTLLVHSSMKSIGEVEGGADTVLDALSEYMKDGLLVLPTHTWATVGVNMPEGVASNPVFSVTDSSVCIGILPELFRKRPGVIRSWHPTHSVAALGKDAAEFVKDNELWDTPCARKSPWGKLLDRDAQIMLLGVDLRRNTFIHGVEEWVDIPGRLTDLPEDLFVITPEGERIHVPSRRHHGDHWSEYFWKVDEFLEEKGVMTKGKFGDATVRICQAAPMTAVLNQLLAINPNLFSNNDPFEKERYMDVK